MSGIINDKDTCKSILRKAALIMLEAEEIDKNFRNTEAWEYIITYLHGEDDGKSCCYFLLKRSVLLARLGFFQVTETGMVDSFLTESNFM